MRWTSRVLLLLMGWLALLMAQEPLTVSRALEILRQQNLTLKQQEARLQQAQLQVEEQKTNLYPTLRFQGSFNYVSELASMEMAFPVPGLSPLTVQAGANHQYDLMALLEQPVFTGFRLRHQVNMSRANFHQLQASKQAVENQLCFRVRQLFLMMQLNHLQGRAIAASRKRTVKNLEMVRNLYRAGQATRYDTMRVANRLLSLRAAQIRLTHQKEMLRTQLETLLNYSPIDSLQMFTLDEVNLTLQPQEVYLRQALANRPELQQLHYQGEVARFRQKMATSRYFPQIFASASYHYARPGVNFFQREWMDYYTLGIHLQWELWNWGRTGKQVQQASLAMEQTRLAQEQLRNTIRQEITEIYQNLQNDLEQIEVKRQLLEQEKERYRVTREKYRQGVATLVDLTDAEAALTRADLQLRQAYVSFLIHQARMQMATGGGQ